MGWRRFQSEYQLPCLEAFAAEKRIFPYLYSQPGPGETTCDACKGKFVPRGRKQERGPGGELMTVAQCPLCRQEVEI